MKFIYFFPLPFLIPFFPFLPHFPALLCSIRLDGDFLRRPQWIMLLITGYWWCIIIIHVSASWYFITCNYQGDCDSLVGLCEDIFQSVLLNQMVTIIIISTPEEERDSELSDWPWLAWQEQVYEFTLSVVDDFGYALVSSLAFWARHLNNAAAYIL